MSRARMPISGCQICRHAAGGIESPAGATDRTPRSAAGWRHSAAPRCTPGAGSGPRRLHGDEARGRGGGGAGLCPPGGIWAELAGLGRTGWGEELFGRVCECGRVVLL
jgi:hypothetical protein